MMQKDSVRANKPKIFNKKPEDIDNDPLPTYENYIEKNKIDLNIYIVNIIIILY